MGLTLAIGFITKGLEEATVSEVLVGPLRMMPAGSDSVGNSGGWEKYLDLPSDSEGQGQGIEGEPTSRKRDRSPDPVEDVADDSKAKQIRDSRSDERTGQARTTYQKSRAQSERKVRAEEGIDLKETYLSVGEKLTSRSIEGKESSYLPRRENS
ncbi:hypothetical protein QVD17_42419 [Tagetes erecta]|uniref:Uncharacterized protein n=1 Tax=Tagetes erecta TaxID=13708 RepID=A0AAD8JK16_TARER|nr:hypothetical protein QVD17_42419 [Tagetes erecta]